MSEERIQAILNIVATLDSNDAAQHSIVTHVIFGDYNLYLELIQAAINDKQGWLEYIQEKVKDIQDNDNLMKMLKEIIEVDNALRELSLYSDEELEAASDKLTGWIEY